MGTLLYLSQISASISSGSEKFQVFSSFMKNPEISTDPFSPRMLIEPSRSLGLVAVVASITPNAPFLNFKIAIPVSSASILTSLVEVLAMTLSTSPIIQISISM